MKTNWSVLALRFNSASGRERILMTLAMLAGLAFIGWFLAVEPAQIRSKRAEQSINNLLVQQHELEGQIRDLSLPKHDPDLLVRQELIAIQKQLTELERQIKEVGEVLIPPDRMVNLLEALVVQSDGVRLLSLRKLDNNQGQQSHTKDDVKRDVSSGNNNTALPENVFKHAIEIRLEGNYQQLTAYLERLEKSRIKVLWSGMDLSAENYPHLVLKLSVFTLSLDKTWLIV